MNSGSSFALTLASAMLVAGPAIGQTTSQSGTSAPAPAKAVDPMNQVVCQKESVVGSRLATRRVCMTRHEWLERQSTDRQDTEKAQVPSAKNSPG